ncbi:MAG: SRPBCC family protein [Opitutaceae bacterium]
MPKLTIERSILINATVDSVYGIVRDFKRWPEWSPWLIAEREAELTFSEDGKHYTWNGAVVGSGEMHLEDAKESQSLQYRLVILKPWKSQSDVSFTFTSEGEGTRVTWRMDGSLPFFMFFMKAMMEGFIGMDYERGLRMLKQLVEEGTVTSQINCCPDVAFTGTQYVGIKRNCSNEEMGDLMKADFEKLRAWACDAGVELTGKPFTIYSKWDCAKGQLEYTAGLPVASVPDALPSDIVSAELPACQAFVVEHTGAYQHLGNAWSAGMCRAQAKLFKQNKQISPFEVYETEINSVPEAEIMTKVYFPLR